MWQIIFIPAIFLVVLLLNCKAMGNCAQGNCEESTHLNSTALPHHRTQFVDQARQVTTRYQVDASERMTSATLSGSFTPTLANITVPVLHSNRNFHSSRYPINSAEFPAFDKPPDYSEVILNDLTEKEEKFPVVKLTESLPPNYGEIFRSKY